MHFEAGAVATKNKSVTSYLIDVDYSQLKPPLSLYQNVNADEPSTFKLAQDVSHATGSNVPEETLKERFTVAWPKLKTALEVSMKADDTEKPKTRPQEEMVEEILGIVRGLRRDANKAPYDQMIDAISRAESVGVEAARRAPSPSELALAELVQRARSNLSILAGGTPPQPSGVHLVREDDQDD
jgi:hypothetical protein